MSPVSLELLVRSTHIFEHMCNQGVYLCCVEVLATSFALVAATRAVAAVEAVPAVEEKMEFNLVLEEVQMSVKIAMTKAVRMLTALELKEKKDMIEGLSKKVKEGMSKEDVEEALKSLEAALAKYSTK